MEDDQVQCGGDEYREDDGLFARRKMEESVSFVLWSPGAFSGGHILTWKKVSEVEPAMVPLESVLLVVTGGACSLPAI